MLVCGIDPGTKSTGLVIFDTETKRITHTAILSSESVASTERIYEICDDLLLFFLLTDKLPQYVFVERFAMRGKAGELLHKLIGGVIYVTAFVGLELHEVYNLTAKKIVGGHGHASKELVANGVKEYFKSNKRSLSKIEFLINKKEFDILDAFAIGIAGYVKKQNS